MRLPTLDDQQFATLPVGKALKCAGYRFAAPTPLTYGRVLSRPRPIGGGPLVEAFGWNRPFRREDLDHSYYELLPRGGLLGNVSDDFRLTTLLGAVWSWMG